MSAGNEVVRLMETGADTGLGYRCRGWRSSDVLERDGIERAGEA
jgi:hypothetical protein